MEKIARLQALAEALQEVHTAPAIDRVAREILADVPDRMLAEAARAIVELAKQNATTIRRVSDVSRKAYRDNRELRSQLRGHEAPQLIGGSLAMRKVIERADLVARHTSTVLILGESGTGKELLARRIHATSPRAHRAFVRVNCGALPEGLLESDLFGHERGAFTGADRRHIGRFERADGGTIFLDEVAELSTSAQVRLLRVLQEGELERLGGEKTIDVDVRVIAATHQALETRIDAGTFREDLYYRLNVFALSIPPLRERKDDIAPLTQHLVTKLARRLSIDAPRVPESVVAQLLRHEWRGNVRELENVLENALILSPPGGLRLPPSFRPRTRSRGGRREVVPFEEAMRESIESALAATGGRIYGDDGAAARLGLNPSTLQSKMRKLKIDRGEFAG